MRRKQFAPLIVDDFEVCTYPFPTHGHTYYELVYIWHGSGVHLLNQRPCAYQSGDLFLLAPGDEHYFEVQDKSRFIFIKFTDSYFASHQQNQPDTFLVSTPEAIMQHPMLKEHKLLLNEPCETILRNVIRNIMTYDCGKDIARSPIVYYHILSIFGMIREAAEKLGISLQDSGSPGAQELSAYIHQHIYQPERVQVKQIAAYFNISPSYFSAYFKRNFQMSYREYINRYRGELIRKRVSHTRLSLKQIAADFGFTDESHLARFFKNRYRQSPAAFRKTLRNAPAPQVSVRQ